MAYTVQCMLMRAAVLGSLHPQFDPLTAMRNPSPPALVPVRIWDLPTRLFHWLLVLAVVGLIITGNLGGNWMVWHARLGLTVLGLLVFRLVWGVAGGQWSRFASFSYSPRKLMHYLRGRAPANAEVGHSPLGALSVWAMLAVLTVQVGTGLVTDDEIAFTGPLARFVETSTALAATAWHKGPGKLVLLALIGLHVGAIVVYHLRGKRLVPPMLHGDKLLPPGTPGSRDDARQRVLALVLALASGALAAWVGSLG